MKILRIISILSVALSLGGLAVLNEQAAGALAAFQLSQLPQSGQSQYGSWSWSGDVLTFTAVATNFTRLQFFVDANDPKREIVEYPLGAAVTQSVTIPNTLPSGVPIRDGSKHVVWVVIWWGGGTSAVAAAPAYNFDWKWPAVKPGFEGIFNTGLTQGNVSQNRVFDGAIYDLQPLWSLTDTSNATTDPGWFITNNTLTTPSLAMFGGTSKSAYAVGNLLQRVISISPNGWVDHQTKAYVLGYDVPSVNRAAILNGHYRANADGLFDVAPDTLGMSTVVFDDTWGPVYQDGSKWVLYNVAHADGPYPYVQDGLINLVPPFDTGAAPPSGPVCGNAATLLLSSPLGLKAYSTATGALQWQNGLHAVNASGTDGFQGATGAPPGMVCSNGIAYLGTSTLLPLGTADVPTYNIYRAIGSAVPTLYKSGLSSLSFADSSVTPGTPYYYEVSAVTTHGESVRSNPIYVIPIAGPASPSWLTGTAGDAQATLQWSAVLGAASYNVRRFQYTPPYTYKQVAGVTGTSYVDTGLTNGGTYYYWVTAVDAAGESAASPSAIVRPMAGLTPPPPPPPATASAKFVKADSATSGSWKGVYGADGYSISQLASSLPTYASMSVSGNLNYVWSASTADTRAVQKPSATDRIAACWYNSTSFTVDLNLTDGQAHNVAFYCLDWDQNGLRAAQIDVLDGTTNTILDSETVSSYQSGKYLVWSVKGHVKLRFTKTGGANTVLDGVFFDTTTAAMSTAPAATSATSATSATIPVSVPQSLLATGANGVVTLSWKAVTGYQDRGLSALNMADGSPVWAMPVAAVPMAVADGRLYSIDAESATGNLACYDLTGLKLWSRAGSYRILGYAQRSHTLVTLTGSNFEVVRGDTGVTIWSGPASPVPASEDVGFQGNRMYWGSQSAVNCWSSPCVMADGPVIPTNAP